MLSVCCVFPRLSMCFFFFNDTATTEIYTLSLHDALPISQKAGALHGPRPHQRRRQHRDEPDRKSTRLNSSHLGNSYAVFCLKKKKNTAPYINHRKLSKIYSAKVKRETFDSCAC